MLYTKNIPLEYHQQDTDFYCGAACAQMVLNQMGSRLYDQLDLYNSIQDKNSTAEKAEDWGSGPAGLTAAMNEYNPRPDTSFFTLYNDLKGDIISRKIIWSVFNYQVSPIALVKNNIQGGSHWVAVTGFQATSVPAGSDDLSYAIQGFFINDPSPTTPLPDPPPPHTTGDRCGTKHKYGTANRHISYPYWKSDYLNAEVGGSWDGQIIAVCDPDPPPKEEGRQVPMQNIFDGEKIIDRQIAMDLAMKSMEEYELSKYSFLKHVLKNVLPGEPQLVQRLDRTNDFYYLLPMLGADKGIRSLVCIDARFGNYREAVFAEDINNPLDFRTISESDILKLLGNRLLFKQKRMVLPIYPEAVMIHPTLVWMPCAESVSPDWPFYMVIIGNHRVFVRIDGHIFTELTTNIRG